MQKDIAKEFGHSHGASYTQFTGDSFFGVLTLSYLDWENSNKKPCFRFTVNALSESSIEAT